MEVKGEAKLLKIFTSNTDKFKHRLVYEMVVFAARRYGIAGATVHKGIMGYGSSSAIHSVKLWELSEKLPVVIELVDNAEKIDQFVQKILPWFEKLRYGCLITLESLDVIFSKAGTKKSFFTF